MNVRIIPDRWEKIIELVEGRDGASVDEIAAALSISATSVRRDLARIDQRGLLKRTWGGAAPTRRAWPGPTLAESRKINPVEKERIGRVAADLVNPGDTVMFDGGFTTFQVARHITAADISVVTNSFDVAQAVFGRDDVTLEFIGGALTAASGTTIGPRTAQQIRQLNADKAILGADAISIAEGLSTPNPLIAQTKRAMIEHSRELIVVADYSKLGRFALHRVAPVDAISVLVTDDKADTEILDSLRAAGIDVVVASGAAP
ncbi:MAG TPA: DeoR/GlpR transcriptional regulator [Candidatus Hydrogenedentes bacterium]|nr:DeoR/GlpR transcriptional regulator [Candidatus Hydrogenedentota bacterium]